MGQASPDNDTTGLRQQVLGIIAEQAGVGPQDIRAGATLDQLGIDSLGKAEIIFAIEETFDVEVPFNANTPDAGGLDLRSVEAIVEGVRLLIAQRA